MPYRKVKRQCPGCKQEKSYPANHKYCSPQCVYPDRPVATVAPPPIPATDTDLERALLAALKSKNLTIESLSESIDRSIATTRATVEALKAKGHGIHLIGSALSLSGDIPPNAEAPLIVHNPASYNNQWRKFGACGDNHLGSKHERIDVVNALYDLYEQEGVTEVFNTGNWIEGNSRLNYHDVKVFGLDDQVDYFIQNYPQRKGITTHFVAGDDHEGWWQKAERIEIGKYAEFRAKDAGRNDLHYLGYVEADIELKAQNGSSWMKVMHPGGGSAYALSYAAQKIVESLQGGEKPQVLLYGHYHKFDYNYAREVHCVGTGCTVDQSIFMRKCKIQAHLGGCMIWLNQAQDGTINRFRVEWIPFYDRGFYADRKRLFGLKAA
jgi:hypothetical protein